LKVKFGLSAIAFVINDFIEQGIVAERAGFDSVWIPDHFTDLPPSNDKYEPWTVLAHIGAKTERIMLGTLATDSIRRHPASMAHVLSTLDNLTDGRAILGIGAGEAMHVIPYGLPWEDPDTRVSRLEESVRIMRLLWKSSQTEPVNFDGRFYHLKGARLDLHPYGERNLPIFLASLGSKRSLQLTGKLADGWLPWFNTPETFLERSRIIDRAAEKAGRSPNEIEKTAVVYLALTNNPSQQKQILDSMKPEIVVLTSASRLAQLGHNVDAGTSSDYSYQKCLASSQDTERACRLGASLPDSVAERFLITGTAETCIAQLGKLVKAGAHHIIIRNMLWANRLEDFRETLGRIGREIIPAFA
jgi:alkanesulfonate monooxygenase SsuD/methylene tetrahydromethanopterin reductase-like flavin-dependent oxidoreductase (luciferase family)